MERMCVCVCVCGWVGGWVRARPCVCARVRGYALEMVKKILIEMSQRVC